MDDTKPALPQDPAPLPLPKPEEFGGPAGPEPTRYGDWETKGPLHGFLTFRWLAGGPAGIVPHDNHCARLRRLDRLAGLLCVCIASTAAGFALGQQQAAFYLTYAALAAALLALERWMPHEPAWLPSDGELPRDIAHTALSTGAVQAMVVFSATVAASAGLARLGGPEYGVWPRAWPLALQVVLGLAVLELALYWAHRIAHEWLPLWRFHAIHHSVPRLWAVNNGRFHFVDAIKSVLPGLALLMALGAPAAVLTWLSALGAYIGMLTHCNVAMRFGALSVVFNTPELHRWHHSKDLREGNKNYGESLMLWDWAFGTWFNPARRPPAGIGVSDPVPARFWAQVAWPFRLASARPGGDGGGTPRRVVTRAARCDPARATGAPPWPTRPRPNTPRWRKPSTG